MNMQLANIAIIVQVGGIATSLLFLALSAAYIVRRRQYQFSLNAWLKRQDARRIVLALIALGILFRAATICMLTQSDEAVYLMMARSIAEGKIVYRDFFALQPPAAYLAYGLMFRTFGVGILQAKIIPLTFSVGLILLVHHTARTLYGPNAGLASLSIASLTTGLVVLTRSTLLYAECLFFSTLAVHLVLTTRGRHRLAFLLAGLCAGAASSCRLFGLYSAAAILIHIALARKNVVESGVCFIFGFLAVTAPMLHYYGMDALRDVVLYNALERPTASLADRLWGLVNDSRYLHALPVVLGFMGVYALWKERKLGDAERLLLLWVALALTGTLVVNQSVQRIYASYFVASVPALAILGGNAIRLKDATVATAFITLAFMALVYNTAYTLTDADYFIQQTRLAESLREASPSLVVSGSSPYAQAVAFLSGRRMLSDVIGTDVPFDVSAGGVDKFVEEMKVKPVAVVLADDVNPDMRAVRAYVVGHCQRTEKTPQEELYVCNEPTVS